MIELLQTYLGCGVCMMSTSWREKQHPAFISYVSSFLVANSYRLNFLPIAPDFIFNNGGVSVAFIFETCWNCENGTFVLSRYNFELGRPTFIPVRDPEMGFEKIVNISHVRGACKQRDAISMMKSERERAIQCFDALLHVVTAIPEIDYHDANALAQAFGSIEAIAKATSGSILESTDLSLDKAERIFRFFRDPQYHLTPRMN
ncbi:DNA ligase-like protein isoform X3 [Carex rostrata]